MSQYTEAIWQITQEQPVFTTSDVVEATGGRTDVISRALKRMVDNGLITKVSRGLWGAPKHPDFSRFEVVPYILSGNGEKSKGYVSTLSALHLHGMIEELPANIDVMVQRQRRNLETPLGTYRFYQIKKELFAGYQPYGLTQNFKIAEPEKALFDALYIATRKGNKFQYLPTINFPDAFEKNKLKKWVQKIENEHIRANIYTRIKQLQAIKRAPHR